MDSTFGKDPAVHWVKITYEDGSTKLYNNKRLNEAYEIKSRYESMMQRHVAENYLERDYIKKVEAGRN